MCTVFLKFLHKKSDIFLIWVFCLGYYKVQSVKSIHNAMVDLATLFAAVRHNKNLELQNFSINCSAWECSRLIVKIAALFVQFVSAVWQSKKFDLQHFHTKAKCRNIHSSHRLDTIVHTGCICHLVKQEAWSWKLLHKLPYVRIYSVQQWT